MAGLKSTRILHRAAVGAALAALALPATVAAQRQPAGDLRMAFESEATGVVTGMDLEVGYRSADDPNAKPPMIRRLVINGPGGMRFDGEALPRCTASDQQLRALGSRACPGNTRIGDGTITAITGFGPPTDPYVARAVLFNTPDGFIEVVEEPSTGNPFAFERIHVSGTTLSAKVARVPGGPPDGETTVREVDLHFDAHTGYVVTPSDCRGRQWAYSGVFTFDYGDVPVGGTAPCDPRVAPARIALTVSPRQVEAGKRTRFRFRARVVDGATRRPASGVTVRFAGKRLRTGTRGGASTTARLKRVGLHLAKAVLPGARSGRALVLATR
jgi:hypothetical protein